MDSRTMLNTNHYEKEADIFAMDLLIGDDMLMEYQGYNNESVNYTIKAAKDSMEPKSYRFTKKGYKNGIKYFRFTETVPARKNRNYSPCL